MSQPVSQPAPNRAQRRARGGNSQGIEIEYMGRTYTVRQTDLTPRLVAELRRETGFGGWMGLLQETRRGIDLDVVAAFIWLARRVAGELVGYEQVLDGMSYEHTPVVKAEQPTERRVLPGDSTDAEDDGRPEA